MRNRFLAGLGVAAAGALPLYAQYPGHVDTTEQANATHLRATAVLEYTGELNDIKASRLLPIVVWDGVQYQPGGLYLAQPAPLAVLAGTQYELESDGRSKGFFNVKDAEDLAGLWIGVGSFQAPPPPAAKRPPAQSGHAYVIKEVDPNKPHFAHVPTDDNGQSGDSSQSGTAKSAPAIDPDRPTLHPRTSAGSSADAGAAAPAPVEVDPDRPTFHRHEAPPAATSEAAIDPNRPHLSYATPESQQKLDKPDALFGVPADLRQMAAISDSNPVDTQTFGFSWSNPEDAVKMEAALEAVAEQSVTAPPAASPAAVTKTTHSAHHKAAKPAPPALPMLEDVEFHVFGLTFGGGATMVYSAHTATTPEEYVTIVAQPDFYGKAQILLKQVARADSLDVTPRMRLVDAVDTQGSGRGDLLFELRGQTFRQFAIYRIAGAAATPVFVTQATAL
ncbi:MAG TPA: hypothetical protein VHX60_04640 [Acidobacteriaceae bacterium]|nr:hypothetical protein [Acidobacteriaceae bacterium]